MAAKRQRNKRTLGRPEANWLVCTADRLVTRYPEGHPRAGQPCHWRPGAVIPKPPRSLRENLVATGSWEELPEGAAREAAREAKAAARVAAAGAAAEAVAADAAEETAAADDEAAEQAGKLGRQPQHNTALPGAEHEA